VSKKVVIGSAELYLGDCLEILPTLGKVDAVVTDPPYGVGYVGSATRHSAIEENGYIRFEDTPENVLAICVPAIELARKIAGRVCLTPGIRNARLYPVPDGEGVIWYPSGANCGPWGFVTHQPIFYYGKCPFLATGQGSMPTGFQSTEAVEQNGHPCPKPIRQMTWLVRRASIAGETICDPFMGSGTTGVACAKLGRKFIGIEIEPRYFDIACKRIKEAHRQLDLFNDFVAPIAKQLQLAAE
jgi:site-specific DNA-methyltransferase (adenine-specific)